MKIVNSLKVRQKGRGAEVASDDAEETQLTKLGQDLSKTFLNKDFADIQVKCGKKLTWTLEIRRPGIIVKLFTVLQGWSEWPQQKVKRYQALSKCDEDWVFHLTEKPSLIGSPDMLQTSIIKHWYFGSIVNSKSNTVCSTSKYFSYDSRTGDPGNKGLWSEPAAFGERAHFRVGQSPAVLSIRNLTKEDGGVYTCRSDGLQPPQPGYV